MALTASTADWLYLVLGYGLLAVAARLTWLALRGWHLFAKEEVPMADFVAVMLPWGIAAVAGRIDFALPASWQLWIALAAAIWLVAIAWLGSSSAAGLRWRALGTDPAALTRLGINTHILVAQLAVLALLSMTMPILVTADQMGADHFGHWALAGLAILLLGGRMGPVLIVITATVTIGRLLAEQIEFVAPLAIAAAAMSILLLLAKRWREPDHILHVD